MTPEAIGLVKTSYATVAPRPGLLAARFYHELFSAAPSLRPLFPSDLTALQGHFEAALSLVIRNLDEISALREPLRDLGAQHVHWGARPEDYLTAREALVAAIRSIAPLWDDFLTNTVGTGSGPLNDVLLYTVDTANSRLIIEWNCVRFDIVSVVFSHPVRINLFADAFEPRRTL